MAALAVGLTALILAVRRRDLIFSGGPGVAAAGSVFVRDIPPHWRVFNTDTLGGFVILERPDVQVSLDTRNDLYGRQRVLADVHVVAGRFGPGHGPVCARAAVALRHFPWVGP